jgi:hypothetical protein
MQPDQARDRKKHLYVKPRLRTIELAAEEVLVIGCKQTNTGPAVDLPSGDTCTLPTPCYEAGS